ncbi:MAG TPA: response regulator [Thermodesulfovibrionales bacterium]|nr:response regulator [Thermodesulfovibrionales bacterium]
MARKILVVDDDDLVRMLIKRALELKGFEVVESDDGDTAVDMVDRYADIGLVILDLKMPRMGGKEAYAAIRLMRPGLKCIVSSAYINENDEEELSACGVNAFLKKPYLIEDLYRTVDSVAVEG